MRINKSFIALTSSDASVAWSNITGTPTTLSGYGITDGVPTSRTITINGTTYDLSANRTWTVSDTNIYTTSGTLTANRTVTLGGYDLTFTGSATSTVVSSTGRLLIGGATDTFPYLLNVNGYANIGVNLNVGVRIDAQTIVASITSDSYRFRASGYMEYTLISSITTPASGNGFIFGKTDKKIYWKDSDGVEYDLTSSSTSVPLTRTLTINDTALDLSADRSWSIGDYGTW